MRFREARIGSLSRSSIGAIDAGKVVAMVRTGFQYLGWIFLVAGCIGMEHATTLGKFYENMGEESKQRLRILCIAGPCMLVVGAVLAYRFRKPRA